MKSACPHWQNGKLLNATDNGGKCVLPVCACKLEMTDISHLETKDAHAEIGYNPYSKPYTVEKKRRYQFRGKR